MTWSATKRARKERRIRWMNLTSYLKARKDKTSRQIVFAGEKLDFEAIWRVRGRILSPPARCAPEGLGADWHSSEPHPEEHRAAMRLEGVGSE